MAETLVELLADHGIRPKHYRPGQHPHAKCPKCEGGRTRELSLALHIDDDGTGFTAQCHRGTCGWTAGGRVHREEQRREPQPRRPETHTETQITNRPEWLYQFFAARKIGKRTVDSLGIYATTRRFPPPIAGDRPAIVFPYRWRGEVVNRKYRPHPEKQPQQQEQNALPTLFNVDALGDKPEAIVWVEGEPDVAALTECGIAAVSLANGAPAQAKFREDDQRFAPLAIHADMLATVKRFVLAGDMDPPGMALREELARRLGRHRCWLVTWPDGCKDACDVLIKHGPDAVQKAVADAEAYPIEGMQRIKPRSTLLNLRYSTSPAALTTGARSTDEIGLRFPSEGRIIIITGIPSHGKSSWAAFVMVHLMRTHDRRFLVYSPEMEPWEEFVAHCASVWSGKPFRPGPAMMGMSDGEIIAAEEWFAPRLQMLTADPAGDAPTVEWFLERGAASVLRDGTTDVVIDPWNELEHGRAASVTETEYIGRSLQRLRGFTKSHGCNVWIIAHPQKQRPAKPGDALLPPGLYEINGSAHWANKADLGITVHTPGELTEIHVGKARFRRWGRRGTRALLAFDPVIGRYSEPSHDPADEPISHWSAA